MAAENPSVLVVQVGDPVLRARAAEVPPDEVTGEKTREVIARLRKGIDETPGVGLAAPQIGVPLRIVVVQDLPWFTEDVPDWRLAQLERGPIEQYILINPRLELLGAQTRTFAEGCLSVAGFRALVRRHHRLRVNWIDEHGREQTEERDGWHARILQHEVDHLDGIIYTDRMLPRSLMTEAANRERWWLRSDEELDAAFDLHRPLL